MRITRKILDNQITCLNRNLNRPATYGTATAKEHFTHVGHFHLEIVSPGDGWTRYSVLETVNKAGAVHSHFSGNGQDVYAYLRGVDDATRMAMFPKAVL